MLPGFLVALLLLNYGWNYDTSLQNARSFQRAMKIIYGSSSILSHFANTP
jgi:hypothetical protein